jgi:Acyl-CoA reductase (LuxC)
VTHLQTVPARTIVRALADAAQRWRDGDFPPRVRLLDAVTERTGYSVPVVEYALDHLFGSITESQLIAVVRNELGSLEVLDGFSGRHRSPDAWAAPLGSICILSSRTTIGVALTPAIFALCAKCDVLVKDREDTLIAAFFQTLSEELDEFARGARARAWSSDEEALDLAAFDGVVAFGSDQTLADISKNLRPGTRFIGYGSRASAGYVCREALDSESSAQEIAVNAARDLVLYESEGCLSLHVLFVESGGVVAPARFCELFAQAVEHSIIEFPRGRSDAMVNARLAQRREVAAFRSASGRGAVYADKDGQYAVFLDPPAAEPPQFLPRTIGVITVDQPSQALEYLQNHRLPLEGFALCGERPDLVGVAVAAGAVRVTRFGELQRPPLTGHHGGRARIADFVRWIDKAR